MTMDLYTKKVRSGFCKNNIKWVVLSVYGILLLIFLFNILINPYGDAVVTIEGINAESVSMHSKSVDKINYMDAYIPNSNAAIIGSSQIAFINTITLDKITNHKWVNFSIGASMASEHYNYIRHFGKKSGIKLVLYGIDDYNLFGKYPYRGDTLTKGTNGISIFDYLTLETVEKSISKIEFNLTGSKAIKIGDELNGLIRYKIDKQKANSLISRLPLVIKDTSRREVYYFQKIFNDYDGELIPFVTIYHPYLMFMKRKENYVSFIEAVLGATDFVYMINPEYISDLMMDKYYTDSTFTHTNTLLGDTVVKSIFSKDGDFMIRVSSDNYIEIIDKIFEVLCSQDWSIYNYSHLNSCS